MSKRQILLVKLQNMIDWLTDSQMFPADHDYIQKLKNLFDDYDKLSNFLHILSNFADENCNISDNIIMYYINNYININFSDECIIKFKKYLKFFVTVYRN